jgi:hypothetical protein
MKPFGQPDVGRLDHLETGSDDGWAIPPARFARYQCDRRPVRRPKLRYLPSFEIIKGMLNLTTARGRTRVDMTYEDFQKMIRTLLSVIEVDEAFYLERNPDVADGIRRGGIRSAREHFIDHGYFEGRQPYRMLVDEKWYVETHADIAETLRDGVYMSGQDHFDGPGYPEGRAPGPGLP